MQENAPFAINEVVSIPGGEIESQLKMGTRIP